MKKGLKSFSRAHKSANKSTFEALSILFRVPIGFMVTCLHKLVCILVWIRVNDPSAGSPTETLLRLLLPLNDKV